ncbi:MAG: hypothetical protein QOI78_1112 [Actinomycetota bacterium]|nr:hypothetical protein [Actinomycetota bacterium]
MRDLLDLVGAEPPAADEPGVRPEWHHWARRLVGTTVTRRAEEGPASEEWCEPLIRAAVHEPDPNFNRQLVEPVITAFGRRRVQVALIAHLDAGTAPDMAGAARAWYWTETTLTHLAGAGTPAAQSRDLRERYHRLALRRFVTETDLDVRRSIVAGLPLDQRPFGTGSNSRSRPRRDRRSLSTSRMPQ